MPVTKTDDPVLKALRAEYQSKFTEADSIIGDPNATGERLTRAEKLSDECKALETRIEERTAELERIDRVKGSLGDSRQWADGSRRGLPFSATMGGKTIDASRYGHDGDSIPFHYAGSEPAGEQELRFDPQRKLWEMVRESGPGLLNADKKACWATLSTFEYKLHFQDYLRKGSRAIDLHYKTLLEGLDDQGGVFAPAEFIARVIGRLPAPTSLRALVTTLTTGRDLMILPRKQYASDDKYTTAFRVNWTGETPADGTGAQAAVDDTKLLGTVEIPIHTAMMNGAFSRNMIEDSAFPLQAWLEQQFAETVDLTYEDMIINGTGVGQPFGYLVGAASGNNGTTVNPQYPEVVLSGAAGALAHDGLIDLQTALAPQYENDYTRFVFNKKSTYRALNKLKDSQLRPLFTTGYEDSGLVGGRKRILLGDPIVLSQFAPDVGSTAFPILYGDLRGIYLGQRVGFSVQILDQTAAKRNLIEIVGRVRFGSKVIEPWRLKLQKSNDS